MRPTDVNGINKVAGEYYHLVYNNVFGVRACSLRLTNVYGPRQLIRHNRQGFIGWFIRLALDARRSRSSATARRSATSSTSTTPPRPSCAPAPPTRSTARSSTSAATSTGPTPTWWRCWSTLADGASFRFVEWPADKKVDRHRQLLRRLVEVPGAPPAGRRQVRLREGLARTLAFYREHYADYVAPEARRADRRATRRRREHGGNPRAVQRAAPWRRSSGDRRRRRPRRRQRLVRARSRGRRLRSRVRRRDRRRPRRGRQHRHRRDRPGAARASASAPATR